MFAYEHTWQYMEGVWEGLDARVSNSDSWNQLNEGMEGSGGLEIQAQGDSLGCVLGGDKNRKPG